jgi:hypothetical protein
MTPSEQDFQRLGLSADDWKAFIYGRGQVPEHKLAAARAEIARVGRYSERKARDTEMLTRALQVIGTTYAYLWDKDGSPSHEEKIRFLQARDACSREQAEAQLARVREDNERLRKLTSGSEPKVP